MHMILFLTSFDVLNCMLCLVKLYKCWLCISLCTTIFLLLVSTCYEFHCKEADVFWPVCSNCLLCVFFSCGDYYPGRRIHLDFLTGFFKVPQMQGKKNIIQSCAVPCQVWFLHTILMLWQHFLVEVLFEMRVQTLILFFNLNLMMSWSNIL